jgi:hypothetical protein
MEQAFEHAMSNRCARLLDHLVGSPEQQERHGEAEPTLSCALTGPTSRFGSRPTRVTRRRSRHYALAETRRVFLVLSVGGVGRF